MHNMDMQKKEVIADRPFVMEENGESKELHPCKYCNKAFGTHTNMRRHQRRIHERHLLPKGVRRKGMLLQEAQQLPDESPSASPPPVYMPSADTEDETDRDDYAVDISKNISDNLNYYIDAVRVDRVETAPCALAKNVSKSEQNDAEVEAETEKSEHDTKRPENENGLQEEALKTSPGSPNISTDTEPTIQEDTSSPTETTNSLQNGKMESNIETEVEKSQSFDKADLSPKNIAESSTKASPAHSPAPASPKAPSPKLTIPESHQIKEEAQNGVDKSPISSHAPEDKVDTNADSDKTAEEENDLDYCKTFVCNVVKNHSTRSKNFQDTSRCTPKSGRSNVSFVFSFSPMARDFGTPLLATWCRYNYVCSVCSKEFAFLCNLEQHQQDLHPNTTCTHTIVESGKLRPQNYTDPSRAKDESSPSTPAAEPSEEVTPNTETEREESDMNGNHTQEEAEDPNEELYTTIKIMASEGGKPKGPDVRLGINQHYPSFKPPPFPYHSRSHASVASATNFTTHNIPQTFSTAIRCTKCGNSFDNMPELHQHILACANASDKKRYTPKKNPIPLKQIVKSPNGVVSPSSAAAGQGAFRRMGQPKRLNFNVETGKTKMTALSKKKNQLVQKAITQKNKSATNTKTSPVKTEEEQDSPSANVCPHCSREFTYAASLTKHCGSCPMKPVVKKGKKADKPEVKKEPVPAPDKSMSLRKKAADPEPAPPEPEAKPLGKTRARSSGAAEPEPTQTSKGKGGPGRPKRPASLPEPKTPAPESKPPAPRKAKKGSPQSAPPADPPLPSPHQNLPPKLSPKAKRQRPRKQPKPSRLQ
ncbi:hypothetical protein WMY93_008221 [Mugilogobius chulae]|uniref:C2H2-type domain-containing protein n=1 Tax=Mugilogobius chulae TaxID=88201 RepID=A0AAW0PGJ9_9GOBI